ncbi:MAG: amidohydrolase [Acidobacteriota bacterium]|nr:amidohydrolase [Acidobacteriota bacterium]
MRPAQLLILLTFSTWACAQSATRSEVQDVYADAYSLYTDFHQNPELSAHETHTAEKLGGRLRSLGYDVTEHVGGTGVVAVLKNGTGPTVMLRTELDGLPVEEKTGLPYASKIRTKDDLGREVSVMHACGHDIHMASLFGTASVMAHKKNVWHGTLILIGQPAEETISGAHKMIEDGLFTRFPKPDVAIALHVGNGLPAGSVGMGPGYRYANADSLRITIYGKGGHGAAPETTIDPIVIVAKTILSLQTIVSREVQPGEAAVITVGTIHAGTKNNIIPDQAELGLTVRTYKPEIRRQILAAIARIVKAEAESAGATRSPLIENYESTDAVYNDPSLAQRLTKTLSVALGDGHVSDDKPQMVSEDFSYFTQQGIPSFYFSLGGASPEKFAEAKKNGNKLPSNHSSLFAPDAEPTIRTAITTEVAVLRDLLQGSAEALRQSITSSEPAH